MSLQQFFRTSLLLSSLLLVSHSTLAAVEVGQTAADFTLPDLDGKARSLRDYAGKLVVLEWHNTQCPFVRKHYKSANIPNLQQFAASKNVVWLSLNSTHPKHEDFRAAADVKQYLADNQAQPTAYLVDSNAAVAKLYGAKTTPQIWLIDGAGKVLFAGGIDDKRSTNLEDVKTARNHARMALDEALAGKTVSVNSATPYGCGIKSSAQ